MELAASAASSFSKIPMHFPNYPRLTALLLATPPLVSFAADPLAVHNPAHIGRERAAYLDATVFAGNDLIPVNTLFKGDKWQEGYEPKDGKNVAVAAARLETGIEWKSLRIGYVARQEWFARAHRDTLDVYRASELKQPFSAGRRYQVDYQLEGFSAHGMQIGGAWSQSLGNSGWKLDLGASVSLLKGQRIRREAWQGSATALSANTTVLDANVGVEYDRMQKDMLPPRSALPFTAAPEGSGHAVDFGFSLGREDGLRLDWAIADAIGKMRWKDVPNVTVHADQYVVCRELDAACIANKLTPPQEYNDAAEQRVRRSDFSMRLQPKHMVTFSMPVNQAHVELGDSYREGEHFPRIGVRQHLRNGWGTRLDYDFRLRSVGLALAHRWLYFNYQTDALQPDKAKVIAFSLGARIPF
jgi:hypothetical protein